MANRSRRPVEPFWFTPLADRSLPAEKQSSFRFRPLNQVERMHALDNVEVLTEDKTGSRQLRFRNFQQAYEIVIDCLIEAKNFPSGAPVDFPAKGSREEKAKYLEMIDDHDVYAMGDYVFDHSTIGVEEKNS